MAGLYVIGPGSYPAVNYGVFKRNSLGVQYHFQGTRTWRPTAVRRSLVKVWFLPGVLMLRLALWSSGGVTPRLPSDVNPQSWGTLPTCSAQQRFVAARPCFPSLPLHTGGCGRILGFVPVARCGEGNFGNGLWKLFARAVV